MKITVTLPCARVTAEVPDHEARYVAQYVLGVAGESGQSAEAPAFVDPFADSPEEADNHEPESGGGRAGDDEPGAGVAQGGGA